MYKAYESLFDPQMPDYIPTGPWDNASQMPITRAALWNTVGGSTDQMMNGMGPMKSRRKGMFTGGIPSRAWGGRVNGPTLWGDNLYFPEAYLPDDPHQGARIIGANEPQVADLDSGTVIPLTGDQLFGEGTGTDAYRSPPRPDFGEGEGTDAYRTQMDTGGLGANRTSSASPTSRSEDALSEYGLEKAWTGQKKEPSFWKRLGRGLKAGVQEWVRNGGIGGGLGLIGSVIRGGAGFAISQNDERDYRKNTELRKLWNRYGQEVEAEQNAMKQRAAEMDVLAKQLGLRKTAGDITGQDIENRNKYFANITKAAEIGDRYTPEMANILNQGGVPAVAMEGRTNRVVDIGGRSYGMFTTGDPIAAKIGTLPDDPTKYPIATESVGSGTPGYTTFDSLNRTEGDVIAAAQGIERRNVDAVNSAQEKNVANQMTFQNQSIAAMTRIMEAERASGNNVAEMQGAVSSMNGQAERMRIAQANRVAAEAVLNDPKARKEERAAAEAARNAAINDFASAQGAFIAAEKAATEALGKTGNSVKYLDELRKLKLNPPGEIKPVKERQVNPFNRNPKNNNVATPSEYQKQMERIKNRNRR